VTGVYVLTKGEDIERCALWGVFPTHDAVMRYLERLRGQKCGDTFLITPYELADGGRTSNLLPPDDPKCAGACQP
jgi:hypothetical protein